MMTQVNIRMYIPQMIFCWSTSHSSSSLTLLYSRKISVEKILDEDSHDVKFLEESLNAEDRDNLKMMMTQVQIRIYIPGLISFSYYSLLTQLKNQDKWI